MNIIERKLHHLYLTFVEKLVTPDERAIAGLLSQFFTALNLKEFDKIHKLLTPSASIESRAAGGIVGVEEYCQAMKRPRLQSINLFFDDISLRVKEDKDDGKACAVGILHVFWESGYGNSNSNGYMIDFIKQNGQWAIKEIRYLS